MKNIDKYLVDDAGKPSSTRLQSMRTQNFMFVFNIAMMFFTLPVIFILKASNDLPTILFIYGIIWFVVTLVFVYAYIYGKQMAKKLEIDKIIGLAAQGMDIINNKPISKSKTSEDEKSN